MRELTHHVKEVILMKKILIMVVYFWKLERFFVVFDGYCGSFLFLCQLFMPAFKPTAFGQFYIYVCMCRLCAII